MSKKTLNVLKYVFAACLTAFLIYLALKEISWDIFIDAFQETRWGYVLLSLACAFLALVARNERWRVTDLKTADYCFETLKSIEDKKAELKAFAEEKIQKVQQFYFPGKLSLPTKETMGSPGEALLHEISNSS